MDKEHTCCVTGHRDIPSNKVGEIQTKLRQEVLNAIREGYKHYISGFAAGIDLIFADIVTLLYPQTEKIPLAADIRFQSDDGVTVKVCFVDLFDVQASLSNIAQLFSL